MQQKEAERRAKLVYELMIGKYLIVAYLTIISIIVIRIWMGVIHRPLLEMVMTSDISCR